MSRQAALYARVIEGLLGLCCHPMVLVLHRYAVELDSTNYDRLKWSWKLARSL